MYKRSPQRIYSQLHGHDSIRILELTRVHQRNTQFCGRLITIRLDERPDYVALSYVWGKESSDDPMLRVNGHLLQIRASLGEALQELTTRGNPIRLWVDQICIDQNNETEKEQQVQLMSRIYVQARRVIGWLGGHDDDSQLAFDLLFVAGYVPTAHGVQAESKWQRTVDALMKGGHLHKLGDLFDQSKRTVQAAACLVQRPWFYRLWIVQEAALASTLELCCGNSSIPGDIFFNAVRTLCSVVSDPPMPWLQKPYLNAHKLGLLRAQVHSHALAASALHTPLKRHPTPTPVSLNAGFPFNALAFVSMTPRSLPTETGGLASYKH